MGVVVGAAPDELRSVLGHVRTMVAKHFFGVIMLFVG